MAKEKYFEGNKKGEIKELQKKLKAAIDDRNEKNRREVVSKVLLQFTRGIDISPLFTDLCMMSHTTDLVEKKIVYFILVNKAEDNPDQAVMAINTFHKDCQHPNNFIRGLALRSLCSFRFGGSLQYMMSNVREALKDPDAYVKRAGIMGLLKVFYTNSDILNKQPGLIDYLYQLIRSPDTIVVTDAIQAIEEILAGGVVVSTKMAVYLCNRLKEFDEWGQTAIMSILHKYNPKSDNEMFDIMNLLDDRLRRSCSSVVFAAIRLFIKYTNNRPKIFKQVISRVSTPLITLMTSNEAAGSPQLSYTVLRHIEQIIRCYDGKSHFEKDFRYFFCKYDEPFYNKRIKLQILSLLASENNLGDILNQLNQYILQNDKSTAQQSISMLAEISLRMPEISKAVLKQLTAFFTLKSSETAHILASISNVLRKYPKSFVEVKDSLTSSILQSALKTQAARRAGLSILGLYGEHLPFAPYLLQDIVQESMQWEEQSQLDLLFNSVKLFLKRPLQCQPMLKSLLSGYLSEESSATVKDRAAFYYRSMQKDIKQFSKLFKNIRAEYMQPVPAQYDFDSFELFYTMKQERFAKSLEYFAFKRRKEDGLDQFIQEEQVQVQEPAYQEPQVMNLLEVGIEQPVLVSTMRIIEADDLDPAVQLLDTQFQKYWQQSEQEAQLKRVLLDASMLDQSTLDNLFNLYHLKVMASGEEDGLVEFYLYARHLKINELVCLQVDVNHNSNLLTMVAKSKHQQLPTFMVKYMQRFFQDEGLL